MHWWAIQNDDTDRKKCVRTWQQSCDKSTGRTKDVPVNNRSRQFFSINKIEKAKQGSKTLTPKIGGEAWKTEAARTSGSKTRLFLSADYQFVDVPAVPGELSRGLFGRSWCLLLCALLCGRLLHLTSRCFSVHFFHRACFQKLPLFRKWHSKVTHDLQFELQSLLVAVGARWTLCLWHLWLAVPKTQRFVEPGFCMGGQLCLEHCGSALVAHVEAKDCCEIK